MKTSTALNRAIDHHDKMWGFLDQESKKLADILEDYSVHFLIQAGDGLCIAWGDGLNNSCVDFLPVLIDELMKMEKGEIFSALKAASI